MRKLLREQTQIGLEGAPDSITPPPDSLRSLTIILLRQFPFLARQPEVSAIILVIFIIKSVFCGLFLCNLFGKANSLINLCELNAMDGNKDEALKCLNIGKAALASGDKARALKFLTKAHRLDPNLSVDDLLATCKEDGHGQASASEAAKSTASNAIDGATKPANPNGNSSGGDRNYTDEQLEIVRQIKRNKEYYAILGIEKDCSVEEVRKAYRKLSLRVHPDKNKAPGSEEAFKAVSKAFQCLSDEEMRRQYDETGPREEFEQQVRRRRTHGGFYEEAFDPDEIFRSFFFGNPQMDLFRRAHVMRTRAAAGAQNRDGGRTYEVAGGFNLITLLQVLPILILFLVTYLPYNEPSYSVHKSYSYPIRKVTKEYGVPFYVKSDEFDREFPPGSPSRKDVEHQIIRDYKSAITRFCHMELQRRQWGNFETPYCDQLKQFETVR